jgi:hypothetical protein
MSQGSRVPYRVETSQELNEHGVATCTVALIPDEDEPLEIEVAGLCPKCEEPIFHREPIVVIRGADLGLSSDAARTVLDSLRSAGTPLRALDVEVICSCPTVHPDAPEQTTGCGRSWTLHIEWGEQ